MRHFGIIVNPDKDPGLALTGRCRDGIAARGGTAHVMEFVSQSAGYGVRYTDSASLPADTEAVIVIGGDGTLLAAARDLFGRDLPLIGVNLGTLGYLAAVEAAELDTALDRLFADAYVIDERMVLAGEVLRGDVVLHRDFAINDIVSSRLNSPRVLRYTLYVNGEFVFRYDADGFIISTPMGSTAYNLSAGGPIVMPEAELIVVTPVCAHTLASRSLVLPADAEVTLRVEDRAGQDGWQAVFDNTPFSGVGSGDVIRVHREGRKVKLLKLSGESFVETLSRKLR